jgi:hypothetical protein
MLRYVFRENLIPKFKKTDAQLLGEQLTIIAEQNDGRLKPLAVVEAATPVSHPLHDSFEWDDQAAAGAYRIDQARSMIRSIRVIDIEDDEVTHHAFLNVGEGRIGHSYRTHGEIIGSTQLQDLVLAQAERDLLSWEQRYRELYDLCTRIRAIRARISARRAALVAGNNHDSPAP